MLAFVIKVAGTIMLVKGVIKFIEGVAQASAVREIAKQELARQQAQA